MLDFSTRYHITTEPEGRVLHIERGFHIDSDGAIWTYFCRNRCERPSDPDTWDTRRYAHYPWLVGRLSRDTLQALMQAVAEITDRDGVLPIFADRWRSDWLSRVRAPGYWPKLFDGNVFSILMLAGPGTANGKPSVVAVCSEDSPESFQLDSAAGRALIETFRIARAIYPALEVCGTARSDEPLIEVAPSKPAWWWSR